MAVFSVSRFESQIVSRFIFVLVRVNSWIVSAQKNTIHETTRNNAKRYEITPNDEAIVGIPNLDSKLGHYPFLKKIEDRQVDRLESGLD
jgi:hypothetical protein